MRRLAQGRGAGDASVLLRWTFLACVAVLLLGLGVRLGGRAVSRAYLFPVARRASAFPWLAAPRPAADSRLATDAFVVHDLRARDGAPVHAIELPAPPGARTVVHFHNNRETVESAASFARALRARGLGVVLMEYRGYGASAGLAPSEEGLYEDAEAVLDMLAARGVAPDQIVLAGASLGTGVAAEMACRGRGARLVLVTPYTSIADLVTAFVPGFPAWALLADRFDTLAKAASIRVPTLVIHGDADEIVPFAMGRRVAGAIAGARLLRVPAGRHGDLFARDGTQLLDAIVAL